MLDGRVPWLKLKVIVLWDVKPFSMIDTSVLEECAVSIFRLNWKEPYSHLSGVYEKSFFMFMPTLTPKIKAACFSETLMPIQLTTSHPKLP
jgi:hypothetical protein